MADFLFVRVSYTIYLCKYFVFVPERFVSKRILTYRGDYANLYTKHISWKIYISYF